MTEILELGEPAIAVTLKRGANLRRLSLRISGIDGRVTLSLPNRVSLREAESFLRDKEPWLRKHLSAQPDLINVAVGTQIPVEGHLREVVEARRRSVGLFPDHIAVPYGADKAAIRVRSFLKTLARDRLAEASERYAAVLGKPFGRITLRDTRSRWGSCTSEGNLMYSWRLILAPEDVLDYVAAHEVAHLAEMNHSAKYWAGLARLKPGYEAPRKWLRKNGAALHKYQF